MFSRVSHASTFSPGIVTYPYFLDITLLVFEWLYPKRPFPEGSTVFTCKQTVCILYSVIYAQPHFDFLLLAKHTLVSFVRGTHLS